MRELISLAVVRTLSSVGAGVAAICLAVAVVILAAQVRGQDHELDCRAQDAAELDALRGEVSLELSRGLIAVVREDDLAVNATIERLEQLQADLGEATERRRGTVERCQ